MASNSVLDQEKRKGTNTEEYQKVKSNMTSFIGSIKVIPDAAESLTIRFIQKEWLPSHARNISAEKLITQALDRIKNDAAEHGVLLEMLGKVEGTDQIVKMFTVTPEVPSARDAFVSGSMKPKKKAVPSEYDSGYSELGPKGYSSDKLPCQRDKDEQGKSSDTTVPVPTISNGSVTEPRLDAIDYSYLQRSPILMSKKEQRHGTFPGTVQREEFKHPPRPISLPVRVNFIPDSDIAKALQPTAKYTTTCTSFKHEATTSNEEKGKLTFLHTPLTERLQQDADGIELLRGQIEKLQQENAKLKEMFEEHHMKENVLEELQKNHTDKIKNALKRKEQEVEQWKLKLSKMEQIQGEKCTELQKEIEDLQKKAEDDKTHLERENNVLNMKLLKKESELREAKRLLAEKGIMKIQQENELLIAEWKLRILEERERQRELEFQIEREHQRFQIERERLQIQRECQRERELLIGRERQIEKEHQRERELQLDQRERELQLDQRERELQIEREHRQRELEKHQWHCNIT